MAKVVFRLHLLVCLPLAFSLVLPLLLLSSSLPSLFPVFPLSLPPCSLPAHSRILPSTSFKISTALFLCFYVWLGAAPFCVAPMFSQTLTFKGDLCRWFPHLSAINIIACALELCTHNNCWQMTSVRIKAPIHHLVGNKDYWMLSAYVLWVLFLCPTSVYTLPSLKTTQRHSSTTYWIRGFSTGTGEASVSLTSSCGADVDTVCLIL